MDIAAIWIEARLPAVTRVAAPAMDACLSVQVALVADRSFVTRKAMSMTVVADDEFAIVSTAVVRVDVRSLY